MGEFNSYDNYIYYCVQESLRRKGVAIIVNKTVQNAVLGCNLKNIQATLAAHFQKNFLQRRHTDGKQTYEKMLNITHYQFSSVAQLCLTLRNPMNHSTPGLPVHHQLPEFTQTHVHRVSDAIQPSHPMSSPSPPAPNPSQH